MNRYPAWKYAIIAFAVVVAFLYTLPNFFGESPAVQVSSGKATVKIDASVLARTEEALKKAGLTYTAALLDVNSVRVRFADTDTQLKAKDAVSQALNPDAANPTYVVALNLLSSSPNWLTAIHALPMYLGLDLRGGVHFLLQVDMQAALTKRLDSLAGDVRSQLRDKNIRHSGISREGQSVRVRFRDADTREKAKRLIGDNIADLLLADSQDGEEFRLVGTLKQEAIKRTQDFALKQNITTLHNRINELGVAEPVIQQQGADRIVVQLPGVQDVARAKDLIGRTATLELRMVDNSVVPGTETSAAIPLNSELFTEGRGAPVVLSKDII